MTMIVIAYDLLHDNTVLAFVQENFLLIIFRIQKHITFVFNNEKKYLSHK